MKYFYYTNENNNTSTVIIVDENSDVVTLFPQRTNYSFHKYDWISYYNQKRTDNGRSLMFEICENQFKKFKEHGTVPLNWDW